MVNVYLYAGRDAHDPRRSFFRYVLDRAGITYSVIAPDAPITRVMPHIPGPAVIAGNPHTGQALAYESAEDVIRFADAQKSGCRARTGITALV